MLASECWLIFRVDVLYLNIRGVAAELIPYRHMIIMPGCNDMIRGTVARFNWPTAVGRSFGHSRKIMSFPSLQSFPCLWDTPLIASFVSTT